MSGGTFLELHPPLTAEEAAVEADRCLECGGQATAPCAAACPAGVDVPAFIAGIAADAPGAAARTIFAANLLGGTCARVCPVEELCARGCVLLHDGQPAIDIAGLQRYATDWAYAHGLELRERAPLTHRKVAVVGAGPAGLAVSGELAALGHDVTVYDERVLPGGLVRYGIAPYRQQEQPLPEEVRLLGLLGVKFRFQCRVDERLLHRLQREADAIVLAIGMGGDSDVRYPGDDLGGVWDSLPFIAQLKTGEPPDVGDRVIVLGGGNTAVDCAVEARRLGACNVTIAYRRTRAEMPAYAHEVELAEREGVDFVWLSTPVRMLGRREHVAAVEFQGMRAGAPDKDGRRSVEEIPGSEYALPTDTVIKAIGQRPRREFVDLIDGVCLERGAIVVDERGRTGNPKVFAAGDAINGGATVVEAVRGAKVAAAAIHEVLS
ncbi:MAG TPA: FAD-dependent oxidoreductase [Gaiellaceae bacterium]|jgi:glutamate synthase (NADPH/NADH) small chain